MFTKWSTNTISKSWYSLMKFGHKVVSSQQKFVNDFIHFKLFVSNIIKVKQAP